jgi:hypothetical protein
LYPKRPYIYEMFYVVVYNVLFFAKVYDVHIIQIGYSTILSLCIHVVLISVYFMLF